MHGKVQVVQNSEDLGWESLSERRWCRRILQIHKIVSKMTPSYLKDKLPRNRRPLYSQNNNNTFHEIRCQSSRYMSSFFPDAITFWNNIITHFDSIPSTNILNGLCIYLLCLHYAFMGGGGGVKYCTFLKHPKYEGWYHRHDMICMLYIYGGGGSLRRSLETGWRSNKNKL